MRRAGRYPPYHWVIGWSFPLVGLIVVYLGDRGDAVGWWMTRPFLSNLVASAAGALFGIPVALIVIDGASRTAEERRQQKRTGDSLMRLGHRMLFWFDPWFTRSSTLLPNQKHILVMLLEKPNRVPKEEYLSLLESAWDLTFPGFRLESFVRIRITIPRPIIVSDEGRGLHLRLEQCRHDIGDLPKIDSIWPTWEALEFSLREIIVLFPRVNELFEDQLSFEVVASIERDVRRLKMIESVPTEIVMSVSDGSIFGDDSQALRHQMIEYVYGLTALRLSVQGLMKDIRATVVGLDPSRVWWTEESHLAFEKHRKQWWWQRRWLVTTQNGERVEIEI